jgi:hypothetical protein
MILNSSSVLIAFSLPHCWKLMVSETALHHLSPSTDLEHFTLESALLHSLQAQLKKAAATERKFEEQAVAGANEHGRVAGVHQGVAAKVNNLLPGHHAHTTTGTHNPTQPGIAAKVANVLPGHHAHTTTHNPTY